MKLFPILLRAPGYCDDAVKTTLVVLAGASGLALGVLLTCVAAMLVLRFGGVRARR